MNMKCFASILLMSGMLLACGGGSSPSTADDPANTQPLADAGSDQSVLVQDTVQLDGSASSDADGDLLSYTWAWVDQPIGSMAVFSDSHAVQPSFAPDVAGDYIVSLTVNDGEADSAAVQVVISASVANAAPVANAGADQQVTINSVVYLDASASSDANGDTLLYQWSFLSQPNGSSATLMSFSSVSSSFNADANGDFVVQLVVDDQHGETHGDTVTVTVSSANTQPQANAGNDRISTLGNQIYLDGSQSNDPDSDPLSFAWQFVSKPSGSAASLSNASTASPELIADLPGDYVISLLVDDGDLNDSDQVVVTLYEPLKIENLGVTFDSYDAMSHRAGDFVFGCTGSYKVFIEFGAIVDGGGTDKVLPTFEYIVDRNTQITAIADGEVVDVCWQNSVTDPPDAGYSRCSNISWDVDDYEITVVVRGDPQYEVYYDHVVNPQVAAGDQIQAGDPIGNPGITSHNCAALGGSPQLGRTEIMINSGAQSKTFCPFNYFDTATRSTYENLVWQMMSDWEQYVLDSYGISGNYVASSPVSEQVYDDENQTVAGCNAADMPM